MKSTILESLSGLTGFFTYFGASLLFVLIFCLIYCWITPYNEIKLIREGKIAPAISFGGALIGFILPLAGAIKESVSLLDMLIWAMIAMVVQIIVFSVVRLFFRNLVLEIENDHIAAAIFLAFFSVAIGVLNSASMSY